MSNYKGQLEGFPSEVVEKMLERQVEQGNKRDVGVFEKNKSAGSLAGFSWCKTAEGADFWREVIEKRNFALFFSRYPKKTAKEYIEKFEKIWEDMEKEKIEIDMIEVRRLTNPKEINVRVLFGVDKFTPISEDTGKKIAEAMEAMREIQQNIAMNIKKADELLNFTSSSSMGELTFSSEWQPKEGDVITIESPRGITISIYGGGGLVAGRAFYTYATIYHDNRFYTNSAVPVSENIYSIRLATRKERCIFFSRLVNEGYKWNAKKLKLTKWVPKDGDFVYTPANGVVIYKSGAPAIITYCGINFFGDLDTNTGIGFGYIDGCRIATNSERQQLLDALRKEGKRWNAEKKCIEDIEPIYSIGDIVLANDGSIAIISRICTQGLYKISAILNFEGEFYINDGIISIMFTSDFIKRKANKQEVSKLNEALAKAGYRRSAKMGVIEPLKWRPKRNEMYYFVELNSINLYSCATWEDDEFDNTCYNHGIIFRTEEEAISCAKKMLEK